MNSAVYNDLIVRKIPFTFLDHCEPIWNKQQPEWSHMINGASLTMPYLEPFLIRNVREAMPQISDERLKIDARGFVGQEAQHYQNHERYNQMLRDKGHEQLAELEQQFKQTYKQMQKKSLKWRLAYTAGFETMTVGVTEWLINHRDQLFANADPVVTSFVLWHMVEETEHKNVAFDVFEHLYPRSYWARTWGLLVGSWHVAWLTRKGYMSMLKKEGRWYRLGSRLRVYRKVMEFVLKAGPAMLKAFAPSYHPSKVTDPKWVAQWVNAYNVQDDHAIPLLDTRADNIKPEFAAASSI